MIKVNIIGRKLSETNTTIAAEAGKTIGVSIIPDGAKKCAIRMFKIINPVAIDIDLVFVI